jgi:simple sugar transport system substrate-binding protein
MNRTFALLIAVFLLFASCPSREKQAAGEMDAVSAATRRKGPTSRVLLARYMPEAMADGVVKIAVLRRVKDGDQGKQFLDGCVAEGRSLGFTVDTFTTGEDSRELVNKIGAADYDGLVYYGGGPAPAAAGLAITAFNAASLQKGESGGGVSPKTTVTAPDDGALARASLEYLLSRLALEGPPRIIRIWPGPGIPSQEYRKMVFDEYARDGKIIEAAVAGPVDPAFARNETREALAGVLPGFPPGSVDAIWAPHDELARGCVDALNAAGRVDLKLFSMDISNEDIRLMLDNPSVWLGTAATDPRLAGVVNTRLLAAKLAGEETPGLYTFGVQVIETANLNRVVNAANLALVVPGWGQGDGLFDGYPWMAELKTAESSYLRIAPGTAENGTAPR